MPEPFKNNFSPALIAQIGAQLHRRDPGFDLPGFVSAATAGLDDLELKARSAQITRALDAYLPQDFDATCDLLLASLHPADDAPPTIAEPDDQGLRGWAVMPMADVVAARGIGHFDRSMETLAEMTKRFSSEFAVRPFILHDPDRALGHMLAWTESKNAHVRRLASEGSRPRLPWGLRLAPFVADPAPLIPLLEHLRDDPWEYVRRSVANSLNDISKDHPDMIAGIARDWLRDASPDRARLLRHACRSLIKSGHREVLAAFGHGPARVRLEDFDAADAVEFGGALEFRATLVSTSPEPQDLVLDYVVHHVGANGTVRPKVFKWRRLRLAPDERVTITRAHAMRPITTRRYNDGKHRIELLANGDVLGGSDFMLTGTGSVPT